MDITYIPVPCVCKGVIKWKIKDTETYDVEIYQSPLGAFNGSIVASSMYGPGLNDNYKQGDFVNVLSVFTFGGSDNKFIKVQPGSKFHILGLFNEKSILNLKVESPLSETSNDRLTFINAKGSGLVVSENGESLLVSGPIYSSLKAEGFGVNQNAQRTVAQNFWRVISHNPPFYFSAEHFGLFSGTDENDSMSRTSETDYNIIYRRFVTQTKSIDKWVSTCEGTCAPWVGANNHVDVIDIGKEVLYTKIINADTSRITIEHGEPGDTFINVRVDDVKVSEKSISTGSPGATPANLGNRFTLNISDKGAVKLVAAGSGTPASNQAGFSLTINEKGEMNVYAKGKITFSHSESDVTNNSIVLDPDNGIDLKSKKGFRFNGLALVTSKFLEWMNTNKNALCQVTAIGGPAPIHPAALPTFTSGLQKNSEQDGFSTINTGTARSGTIIESDDFVSV